MHGSDRVALIEQLTLRARVVQQQLEIDRLTALVAELAAENAKLQRPAKTESPISLLERETQ